MCVCVCIFPSQRVRSVHFYTNLVIIGFCYGLLLCSVRMGQRQTRSLMTSIHTGLLHLQLGLMSKHMCVSIRSGQYFTHRGAFTGLAFLKESRCPLGCWVACTTSQQSTNKTLHHCPVVYIGIDENRHFNTGTKQKCQHFYCIIAL